MEIMMAAEPVRANRYRNQLKIGATKTQEVDQIQTIHRPYRDQGLQKAPVNVTLDVFHKDQKDLEQDNDSRVK